MGYAACGVTVMRACAVWRLMPLDGQSEWALGGGQVSARGRRRGAADAERQCECVFDLCLQHEARVQVAANAGSLCGFVS